MARRSAVVHNDHNLEGRQFRPGDPDLVTAAFDWDMATLGDSLFDLGNMLVASRGVLLWALSTEEVAARYGKRNGTMSAA